MGDIAKLNIALAEMDVIAGQPERNFATIERMVDEAKSAGAHLIVFPEMCVGGYFLSDRWTDDDFVSNLELFNDRILALSDGIGIVFGNVTTSYFDEVHPGKDGRKTRYNTALFAQNGHWVKRTIADAPSGRYVKTLQPNYRMFDDERYFTSSTEDAAYVCAGCFPDRYLAPFIFETAGETYRVGLEICEDMWSRDYAFDATSYYAQAGCDFIINISSSPWTMGKDSARDRRLAEHATHNESIPPFVYVNAVGMQNSGKNILSFDGDSAVYDNEGIAIWRARGDFEEQLFMAKLVGDPQERKPYESKVIDALSKTLRRFDEQIFPWHPKWIVGLSGGIDSSVTACLLAQALDAPERIVAYNLASRYNSDITKSNAAHVASKLKIELRNGSIESVVKATDETVESYGYTDEQVSELAQENIQARIRGHLLSTFAQIEGGVIMNNGNKIETALGYATLYGDAIGAISPLGDITKVELFKIAQLMNDRFGTEVIPHNLIPHVTDAGLAWDTMPSAELRRDQRDPIKWFYHDWLISKMIDYPGFNITSVMEGYLSDKLASTTVGRWIPYYGLDDPKAFIDDLEWVLASIQKSVFKRLQAPPIITVTRGSFGNDFRESQGTIEHTARYLSLREQILHME